MQKAILRCVLVWYVGIGYVQMAAILAGIEQALGVHWMLAGLVALFTAFIPLVGAICGMVGAVHGWGWPWLEAGALFFGSLAMMLFLGAVVVHGRKPDTVY